MRTVRKKFGRSNQKLPINFFNCLFTKTEKIKKSWNFSKQKVVCNRIRFYKIWQSRQICVLIFGKIQAFFFRVSYFAFYHKYSEDIRLWMFLMVSNGKELHHLRKVLKHALTGTSIVWKYIELVVAFMHLCFLQKFEPGRSPITVLSH